MAVATRGGKHLIAKQFVNGDAQLRFVAEHTTLSALAGSAAPVPALRGADTERLVLIIEAIEGPTVEEVLRGRDPNEAEQQLVAYAKGIGLLHSVAAEAAAEIRSARQARGHRENMFWPPFARDVRGSAEKLADFSATRPEELQQEMGRSFVVRTSLPAMAAR